MSYRRTRRNGLSASILLIIIALLIVSGNRLIRENTNNHTVAPSYGFQTSENNETAKRVSLTIHQSDYKPGTEIDEYKGIAVYSNGQNYMSSHGLNYSEDGYYYGYQWQCVEFVKRFYYEVFQLKMPDGAGHAKYFFNPMLKQGEFNKQRGLLQYKNGGDVKPQADDLLVFTKGAYGHVAIICGVGDDWIEVVQQNSEVSRERFAMEVKDGTYTVYGEKEPAGWLRLP
jgi:surface antigen